METGQSGSVSEPDLVSVDLESIRKQINDNLNKLRMRTDEGSDVGDKTSSVETGGRRCPADQRSVMIEEDAPKGAETETISSADGVLGGGLSESVKRHDPLFLPRRDAGHGSLPLIGLDGAWRDSRLAADQMQQQLQQHLHLYYLHNDAAQRWRTPPAQQRPLAKTDDTPTDRGRYTSFFVADILASETKKPSSPSSPTNLPPHPSPSRFRHGGSSSKTEGFVADDEELGMRTEAFAAEWNRSRLEANSDVIESSAPVMNRHRSHVNNDRSEKNFLVSHSFISQYFVCMLCCAMLNFAILSYRPMLC